MAGCAGRSVVVSAPTGAGKTAIAEAAAVAVLARGQRVIYTTPLKALSNQKLSEMRARFGSHRVGLQTGDGTLNPGAPPGPGPSPAPLRFYSPHSGLCGRQALKAAAFVPPPGSGWH